MSEEHAFRGSSGPLRVEKTKASLSLAAGIGFEGLSCGAAGTASGPVKVCTDLIGYQRALTDPENEGAILLFTYPQIGNYGIVEEDVASGATVAGVIMRSACHTPSNFRMDLSLPQWLAREGIPAIEDVDTRQVVKLLGQAGGAMEATIEAEGYIQGSVR